MAFSTGAVTFKLGSDIKSLVEGFKTAGKSLEDFGSKGKQLQNNLEKLERQSVLVAEKMKALENAGQKNSFAYKGLSNQLFALSNRTEVASLRITEFLNKNKTAINLTDLWKFSIFKIQPILSDWQKNLQNVGKSFDNSIIKKMQEGGKIIENVWNKIKDVTVGQVLGAVSKGFDNFLVKMVEFDRFIKTLPVKLGNAFEAGISNVLSFFNSLPTVLSFYAKNAVFKAYEALKPLPGLVLNVTKNAFNSVVSFVRSIPANSYSIFTRLQDSYWSFITTLRTTPSNLWNGFVNGITTAKNAVLNFKLSDLTGVFTKITSFGSQATVGIKNFGNAIGNIKNNVSSFGSSLQNIATSGFEGLKLGATAGFNSLQSFGKGLSSAVSMANPLIGALAGIGQTALNIATLGVGTLGASLSGLTFIGLKSANEMQQVSVAFDTMIGVEQRKKLMADITTFAKATPFERRDLIDASKLLIAMGVNSKDVIKSMDKLGNVSAGVGANVKEVAYVYGQVKAQGQAYTQDLNQFATRGIPIYEALAKSMGKTVAQLRDGMKPGGDVKIGFADLDKALTNMTSKGGQFFGLMQMQSKTLGGILSNVKDGFDTMLLSFMGITAEGDVRANSIFDYATRAVAGFQEWLGANEATISGWGGRVFGKIAEGIQLMWVQIIKPALHDFMDWFDNGGKEAMKKFLAEAWDKFKDALDYYQNVVWPALKPKLKEFGEWLSDPKRIEDFNKISDAVKKAGDFFISLMNNADKAGKSISDVKGKWDGFNNSFKSPSDEQKWANINKIFGRASGGSVNAGQLYEVGENNNAEMLMMNGKQYMIPGNKGKVINQNQYNRSKTVNINNYGSGGNRSNFFADFNLNGV